MLPADHTGVPSGRRYDLVCAFEVLEHLADDDAAALADWATLVIAGGHLMDPVPGVRPSVRPDGHQGRPLPPGHHLGELAERLVEAGLVAPRVQVYGWPLGYALELVRNRMDARHLAAAGAGEPVQERTAASGRHQQPGGGPVGRAIEVATLPFRYLQRLAPTRGTGLVAVATRPAD